MTLAEGVLTLAGYDGDLMIGVRLDDVDGEDGACLFPGRLGVQALKSLGNGLLAVTEVDGGVRVDSGAATFEFAVPPVDSLFVLPRIEGEPQELDAAEFCVALDQVVYAASTDQARPLLTGVLLQVNGAGLRLVATDSYRLAMRDVPGHTLAIPQDAILPSRALTEVVRCHGDVDGPLTIRVSDDLVSFAANGTVVGTRLIEGQYPDYQRLLPDRSVTTFETDAEPFVDALERMGLIRGDATDPTVLAIDSAGAHATMRVPDRGTVTEWLDGALSGGDLTVGCNPTFLSDAIYHAHSPRVVLQFVDTLKPATVTALDDDRYTALVMPMRIS
jgi:DNA polymerase-3 subunit beta